MKIHALGVALSGLLASVSVAGAEDTPCEGKPEQGYTCIDNDRGERVITTPNGTRIVHGKGGVTTVTTKDGIGTATTRPVGSFFDSTADKDGISDKKEGGGGCSLAPFSANAQNRSSLLILLGIPLLACTALFRRRRTSYAA